MNEKINKNKSNKILKSIFLVCLTVVFSIILFLGKYFNAYAAGGAFADKTEGKMTLQYTDADGKEYEWKIKINFGNGLRNHNLNDAGSSYSADKISVTAEQTQGDKKDIKFEWLWLGYDLGDESVPGGYYRNLTIQFLIPRTTGADTLEAVGYSQSNYLHSFTDESTEQDIKDGYYRTGATFPLQDMGIGILGDGYEVPPEHQVTTNAVIHMKSVYNKYTVKFDGNGADGGSTTENKCTYQTAFDLNANGFYKNNYNFAGWNTKADGTGTSYTDKQNVNNLTASKNGTVTLYAMWTPNTYTLTFDPDGGTLKNPGSNLYNSQWNNGNRVTVTYDTGNFCSMSNDCPTREGYSFTGWYRAYWKQDGTLDHTEQIYDGAGNAIIGTSLWGYWDNSWHWRYAGDITVYAGWQKNNYSLDFNIVYNNNKLCNTEEITPYLSFDVYVDGKLVAENVPDYCGSIPYGSTYEFKNFRMKPGYVFADTGDLKGTIGAGDKEVCAYVYNDYALAYYDGNGATGGDTKGKDWYIGYDVREAYEKYNGNAYAMENKFLKNNCSFKNYKTEDNTYRNVGDSINPKDNSLAKAVIRSAYNNNFVVDTSNGNVSGSNIHLWSEFDGDNQCWSFLPSGDGYWFIVNSAYGKFLDLTDGNATDLANVQLCNLNWSYAQQWKLTPAGDGYYYISSRVNDNYRFDAQGGWNNSREGQNLCVYHAVDYDGQRWKIDFLNREDYFIAQWTGSDKADGLSASRLIEYYGNGDNDNSKLFESYNATSDSIVRKNTFKKTGYSFKNYNTSSNGSGTTYNATDIIPKSDCQGITLIRNHTNYNLAIKQTSNNSTLHTTYEDYTLRQWWSFIKAKDINAYYIVNQATGQALSSNNNVVKAVSWNTNDSTQLWDLELICEHEYQISVHNSNQYLTMRDDNYVYTKTKLDDTDENYDYQLWNIEGISSSLYVQWEANVYNLTFDANGGNLKFPGDNINNPNGNKSNTVQVKYDSDWYCSMNNDIPEKEGYTFGGWYRKDINEDISEQIYDAFGKIVLDNTSCYTYKNRKASWCNEGDVTLYAYWIANKYTIVFDANKPANSSSLITGNMPNIICMYDTPVNIPANSYQIKGWDFVGFNTKADGSGDNIIPGSTVINLTSVNNGVVTLYAQWDAHIEWNASLSKINNDSIDAFDLTNDDKAVNWEHGLGYGKIMHNTLTYTEFGDMQGFLDVEINTVVPTKIKYEFSDTRINSIQLSNDEHTDIGIENGKAVYLHNVSSATSSGYLHKISFNIPDYEAEFDVNKEKEYSAYVDISVSYNVRNTGNEITETRRVYYNLEELDMSKVHSRIRRQPGQANN